MQHLPEKWLKVINTLYVSVASLLVISYGYVAYSQQQLIITGENAVGTNIASAAFAACCIIYSLLLLRFVRKWSVWVGYLISGILILLANNAAIESSLGNTASYIYLGINYVLVLTLAAFGPIAVFTAITISGLFIAMEIAGTLEPTKLGTTWDVISFIARSVALIFFLFLLRNKYSTSSDRQNYIERYFVTNEVVSLLTDSLSDGVIIIDQDEIIRSINPAALKLLGQNEKDVMDLNYRSVLKLKNTNETAVEETNEPVMQALKTGKSANKEFLLSVPEKQEIFIDIAVSVISEPQTHEKYGAVIILRDVSQKKREETARSEFISTASHEMRTPIAAIEGFIELALNEKVSTVDERARKYLDKARSSTQHLGRLFQDLLVSAKAEDGRISNHPAILELGELLEQQAEVSRMVAQQKGLQLEFVINSSEQSTGHEVHNKIRPLYYTIADPDRIREVATNLIDNSMKYTPSGKVTVGVTGNEEVVQFFIRDTGVGIAQDDVPHLFQKFYRVDSSDTRTTGGTGLGLFICKKIVELYQGRIWVESEKGKGTTFYVNLPRTSSAQAEAMKPKSSIQALNTDKTG